jgi:hypothetical protein
MQYERSAGATQKHAQNTQTSAIGEYASRAAQMQEEEEEEFNRLPWLGQSGRAAAGCACTAAALRC